jgi:hypothetical protein
MEKKNNESGYAYTSSYRWYKIKDFNIIDNFCYYVICNTHLMMVDVSYHVPA